LLSAKDSHSIDSYSNKIKKLKKKKELWIDIWGREEMSLLTKGIVDRYRYIVEHW
jgi:hypothetical protein